MSARASKYPKPTDAEIIVCVRRNSPATVVDVTRIVGAGSREAALDWTRRKLAAMAKAGKLVVRKDGLVCKYTVPVQR